MQKLPLQQLHGYSVNIYAALARKQKKNDLLLFLKHTILFNMPRNSKTLPGVKSKVVSALTVLSSPFSKNYCQIQRGKLS